MTYTGAVAAAAVSQMTGDDSLDVLESLAIQTESAEPDMEVIEPMRESRNNMEVTCQVICTRERIIGGKVYNVPVFESYAQAYTRMMVAEQIDIDADAVTADDMAETLRLLGA
jgi:hypothetical protein